MARYITTTLPYVNASPHIGHALELVQADVCARTARASGEEVFFNSGTDEHGQKIFQAAQKAKQNIQDYVDRYAEQFNKLFKALNLSEHIFIRTTNPAHINAAQEMWRRCDAAGDIYKKSYTGLYCVGCESYKTEKDLIDGECPNHLGTQLEKITEENYFFRLSKYEKPLLEYLARDGGILPLWRRNEAIVFVQNGLEDISISREKKRLSWGIPVPGDDTQVMYVWFDALTNYISTLGWPQDKNGNFKKFWEGGHTLQMAGKDQIRFQSIMWQAMLISAGIKNTDQTFYHGFINSNGHKMSKSIGNVISPYELIEKYGTDATRYLLLRHVHPSKDTDITCKRLDEWYTANLVNGLGNLVARVMTLAQAYLTKPISVVDVSKPTTKNIYPKQDTFSFNEDMDIIFTKINDADIQMTTTEPYKKIKSTDTNEQEQARSDIESLVRSCADIGTDIVHFMPATSEIILDAVRTNTKPENLFPRLK